MDGTNCSRSLLTNVQNQETHFFLARSWSRCQKFDQCLARPSIDVLEVLESISCVSSFQKGLGRSRAVPDAPTESDLEGRLDLCVRVPLPSMERMLKDLVDDAVHIKHSVWKMAAALSWASISQCVYYIQERIRAGQGSPQSGDLTMCDRPRSNCLCFQAASVQRYYHCSRSAG